MKAIDFVTGHCRSNPSQNYFYPVRKAKLKAACKVLQQGCSAPFRMNHEFFLLGWQFSDIFMILIHHIENNLKSPQALPWSLTDLKGLT